MSGQEARKKNVGGEVALLRLVISTFRFYVTNWKTADHDSRQGQGGRQRLEGFCRRAQGQARHGDSAPHFASRSTATNIVVSRDGDDAEARALHGLSRALVEQPGQGRERRLRQEARNQRRRFQGRVQGKVVNLSLGYSHPINYEIPRPDQSDRGRKHEDHDRRSEQAGRRSGRRRNSLLLSAGALQGQGCEVFRREVSSARKARPFNNIY